MWYGPHLHHENEFVYARLLETAHALQRRRRITDHRIERLAGIVARFHRAVEFVPAQRRSVETG